MWKQPEGVGKPPWAEERRRHAGPGEAFPGTSARASALGSRPLARGQGVAGAAGAGRELLLAGLQRVPPGSIPAQLARPGKEQQECKQRGQRGARDAVPHRSSSLGQRRLRGNPGSSGMSDRSGVPAWVSHDACAWLCQCSACLLCEGRALLGFLFIFAPAAPLLFHQPWCFPSHPSLPAGGSDPVRIQLWLCWCRQHPCPWLSVLENAILTGQCLDPCLSPHPASSQGLTPILHCQVLLTHMGQIPVNWCSAELWGAGGRRRGPSSREEEGEGVRKSYGGEGG